MHDTDPQVFDLDKGKIESAWYAVTGSTNMDYIIHEGKVYISVSTILRAIMFFRTHLARLGMTTHKAITGKQVLDLFGFLIRKLTNLYRFRQYKEYATKTHTHETTDK